LIGAKKKPRGEKSGSSANFLLFFMPGSSKGGKIAGTYLYMNAVPDNRSGGLTASAPSGTTFENNG
jgi:hypothetical protein